MLIRTLRIKEIQKFIDFFTHTIQNFSYLTTTAREAEIQLLTQKYIKEKLKKDPFSYIIALDKKDTLLGFCINTFEYGIVFIDHIFLSEEVPKGRGIGTQLMNKCIEFASVRDAHKIWASIHPDNTISQFFFKKNGFHTACILKKHWYKMDFIMVEKFLWKSFSSHL